MDARYIGMDWGFREAVAFVAATIPAAGPVVIEQAEHIPEPAPPSPPVEVSNRHARRARAALARRRR